MRVCAAPIPASTLLLLFLHLLRLPVTHAVYTHTHRPGCVNSWEAGLSNEVAATTRVLPPSEQSPERWGEPGREERWSRVGGGNGVARGLRMLWIARAPAQVLCPEPAWARAHAPRAGQGRRRCALSRRPRAQRSKLEEEAEEKFP